MEHRLQVRLLCYNDNPKTLEYGDDFQTQFMKQYNEHETPQLCGVKMPN